MPTPKSILRLTLHRRWFDMIASGGKVEEYREIKPYWEKRLHGKWNDYEAVLFTNGYGPARPWMLVEVRQIRIDRGFTLWGAPDGKLVYVIQLGQILKRGNINHSSKP
jgi:hypothetical protein